jgi:hypothetical protein
VQSPAPNPTTFAGGTGSVGLIIVEEFY